MSNFISVQVLHNFVALSRIGANYTSKFLYKISKYTSDLVNANS